MGFFLRRFALVFGAMVVSCSHRVNARFLPVVLPRLGCFLRFGLFRFDVLDFSKYSKYFRGDSKMSLAQTGSYYGADGIEEYVKFVFSISPYFDKVTTHDSKVNFQGYNRRDKRCKFLVTYDVEYTLEYNTTGEATNYNVAHAVQLYFHIRKRYIPEINVYYTDDYVNLLFGRILDSDQTRNYICSVYEGPSCSNTLPPPTDCVTSLAALSPMTNETGGPLMRVDGNSQSCRSLHAVLANFNSRHCPHISFDPMPDVNDQIKCQTDGNLQVLDLFAEADLQVYRKYLASRGYDPELGHDYYIQTNETDSSQRMLGEHSFLRG